MVPSRVVQTTPWPKAIIGRSRVPPPLSWSGSRLSVASIRARFSAEVSFDTGFPLPVFAATPEPGPVAGRIPVSRQGFDGRRRTVPAPCGW